MKYTKKIMAVLLCAIMLSTTIINEGWFLPEAIKVSAMSGHEQKYDDARLELDFNKGWSFSLGDNETSYMKGFDDSSWEKVDLPHDFSMSQEFSVTDTEAESGNLPGGTGWYRKWFNLYDYYTGEHIFLNFDGAYQHTYVYVNGQFVGENHYGYNSFSFEISEYLICSNTALNLIAVKVVNDIPSSRWYSGSGINRNVTLTIAGPVHISLYGPQVTTPDVQNGGGTARAAITMHNDTDIAKKVTVEATILDDKHNPVSETVVSSLITVSAQTEQTVTLEPKVNSPELWSLDNPKTYKLKTVIKSETGELIDEYHTTFGYRYINWDADKGFSLNGEYMKLKGVCMHHDQGALGAAQEYDAIYRQLVILKDMGCNAIRTSHNSTSRIVIDICNELGMLVMEEFFDGWDASKNYNENDFSEYFHETVDSSTDLIGAHDQEWYEFVVEQTVLRDRHDPCIIAWDVGNELCNITDGESTDNYEEIATSIDEIVDRLDPSRVIMQGNNRPYDDVTAMIDEKMDVIGGNYSPDAWAYVMNDPNDSRSDKPFVSTEAASAINSRGVYDTMSYYDYQCTSYDTNAVSWGNEATKAWHSVVTNDWYSGEFVWTGFDYIGEPTPWNDDMPSNHKIAPNSSYFGIVDTAGFAKDSYYLYRSWWNDESTTLHLVPGSWNQESLLLNNGYANVAVYSNAKKVELLLNGSVIATATSSVVTTPAGYEYQTWTESITDSSKCAVGSFYTGDGAELYPQFSVKYAAGTLSVKAYDENNNEITDTVGSTKSVTGTATQVVVNTWQNKDTYVADSSDYIYVEFEARDANGNFMNDYNGTLNVKVDDSSARYAEIAGVDNGNAATTEKYQQSSVLISGSEATVKMFNGKALVILRTTEEEGTINITATATDGSTSFSTQGVTVTSVTETGVELTDELDEVVTQSGNKYQPTLYDKYEILKYHINGFEAPQGGSSGGSGDSGETVSDKYNIYLANPNVSEGCIPDGKYVIFSENNVVMSGTSYEGWAIATDNNITEVESAGSGSAYAHKSFKVDASNEYTFKHLGGNNYSIKNSRGEYLYYERSGWYTTFGEEQPFKIYVSENGAIQICSEPGVYIDARHYGYFNGFSDPENSPTIWLYSAPSQSTPSEPTVPDADAPYQVIHANTSDSPVLENGDYVISRKNFVMTNTEFDGWSIGVSDALNEVVWASSDSEYAYESFKTGDENVFNFTHQGGNKYYIQNKDTGEYLSNTSWMLLYEATPSLFTVKANADGSVLIYNEDYGYPIYIEREWSYFEFTAELTEFSSLWLYSKPKAEAPSVPTVESDLYYAMIDGISEDYSIYTSASFEALLNALEVGVNVYSDPNATEEEYVAATQAIYDAINVLTMDVKKIDGTLFKYGYSNVDGTPDYSAGGTLINNVSVKQMKNAILADENLVSQLKQVIGYDTRNWGAGYADRTLEGVAEAYARIYTLQFTGVPYNGSSNRNAASNYSELAYCTWPTVSLWNMWTKNNTHGANDPVINNEPVHDGASVQGLAGALLENGVVTSHTAYTEPLSYANYGPGDPNYDVTNYVYSFETGTSYETVTLEYLSGISVYFPDLFSRENLDANGNPTTATTGEFSKYYWDAQFPMFISTDEYGVNTYHFDSADTNYLVQSNFDDENQTVDMELSEVGYWKAYGSNSGSGFFPFNYKQGTTDYTGENAIYHYGFTFEHNFYIPKGGKHVNGEDVVFSFSGDDDVLVYVDGVLVLDNGGLHGARAATIDFTTCSINYQYAMDVTEGTLKGGEYETTYSYNEYFENPETAGYNADTIAAINKLHEVISDGEVHTLNFFYLERGASDSNCKISFNLSETSEEVKITDQTLTLDYGLPVEYNITENNNISQNAIDNGAEVEYLGLCAINEDYSPTYTFETPEIIVPFEDGVTYTVDGMKYGTCTIDKEGNLTYDLESMNMAESENFYVVAKITGDPTYAEEVVYYQVEKTTFIPATAIYYEDTFDTITYTNGKVPSGYDNTANQYGIWQSEGMQSTTLKQTADLTDSEANPYSYETNYMSFAEYSGGSSHFVDVSTKNNPNSKYSGGPGAAWPTVDFTFTGTGFDLISVTDSTTGAFSVAVKDENGKIVKNTVVDTFYGYNYGRIYMDANGKPSLDDTLTPMYKTETGVCTSDSRYYDENGAITVKPHYYDADGNVVETETDSPAYAYAYGWVVADGSGETLYQIPVIKITDLEYGNYSVTITPTFTSVFGHASEATDGTKYYSIYLDAIKIYSPAGEGDNIADADVKDAYAIDDELYPSYLELKNMLIGADSLSENDKQGVIFIDGVAALDNDIGTYKNAGPNNELYLAEGQAVAFEIWATSVPTDVQLGTKLACGNPTLTVSYDAKTTDIKIETATDIYYSLNTVLPHDGKLTWRQVDGADGNKYYTTGTVVVQNTGDEDSVLSITNMKWTFSQYGGKGYFRIPTPIENEVLTLTSTEETPGAAYSMMRMRTAALDVKSTTEPEVVPNLQGDSVITLKLKTSSDVVSLAVADKNGKAVDKRKVECVATPTENGTSVEWTVNITVSENGVYDYLIAGIYENGYANYSKAETITVTVDTCLSDQQGGYAGIFEAVRNIIAKIIELVKKMVSFYEIEA